MNDSLPISEALLQARRETIAALPDDAVAAFAKADSSFSRGGFRAQKAGAIREVLQKRYAAAPLPPELRRLIARYTPVQTFLRHISEKSIVQLDAPLSALFGRGRFLFYLSLDEREALRTYADEAAAAPDPALPLDDAVMQLREAFEGFTPYIGTCEGATPEAAQKTETQSLRGQLAALRAENRRLQGCEDRANRFKQQLADAIAARERLQIETDSLAAAHQALKREFAETQASLQREENQRDLRAAADVELRLSREFHGWVAPQIAVEKAAAMVADDDILLRAEEALQAQAALDRASGNRLAVLARLDALRAALAKVDAVAAEAIVPLPELTRVRSGLVSEVARLEALVEPKEVSDSPLVAHLQSAVATAADEQLPMIRNAVAKLVAAKLLVEDDRNAVNEMLRRRTATLNFSAPLEDKDALPADGIDARYPVLAKGLRGQGRLIVLIDGHNMLFALPGRYSPQRGRAMLEGEKRDKLVRDIVMLFDDIPAARAWIVFDGGTRADLSPASNVRVSYSGGQGEHRADGVLIDQIRFFSEQMQGDSVPIWLVSNDNALCGSARRLGAETISVHHFAAFLQGGRS